jgi:hypothetical protein
MRVPCGSVTCRCGSAHSLWVSSDCILVSGCQKSISVARKARVATARQDMELEKFNGLFHAPDFISDKLAQILAGF